MYMNSILSFLQQSLVLTKMQRRHKRHLGNSDDSIAEHTYHASLIAYCLCRMEGLNHEQGLKAMGMTLIHDVAEVRTADHGFVEKHYVEINEDKANKDTFLKMDFGKDLFDLNAEFEAKETQIAKIVKDADSLQQIFLEWDLMWQGNLIAKKWFESDFKDRVPGLRTESAKKIAESLKTSNPNEWWWSELVDEDDRAKDISKLLGKK